MFSKTMTISVDGNWAEWSDYMHCSSACGGGTKAQERRCQRPEPHRGGRDCQGVHYREQVMEYKICCRLS